MTSGAYFSSWYILCEAEHETSLTWCTSDSTSQQPTAYSVLHTHVTPYPCSEQVKGALSHIHENV